MRLTRLEKKAILEAVKSADPQARVYLFGSRTDDFAKGGDIDLLIFSNQLQFRDKLKIKARLFKKIDEQKIDLLIAIDDTDPFVQMALENSLELHELENAKNVMKFKKEPAFINRQEEMAYLQEWISQRPEQVVFLYGPKSSGKTTLIYKFIDYALHDTTKFSVKMFNLREVLLVNYEDFLQRFFALEDPTEKDTSQTREYDVKVFRLTVQTHQKIQDRQLDPFDVMKAELKEFNTRGIRPVLIIDELQALDFIYFNSQRELIKELLNFFVAMTKESHLCHVLLSSSDGYFIEKLYTDSKLKKTAKLFEIDYLPKDDIVYWLKNLSKESNINDYTLSDTQIEYIWEHFGGSLWEISSLLGDFLHVCQNGTLADEEMQAIAERYMLQCRSYFEEYAGLDVSKSELLREIDSYVQAKGLVKEKNLKRLLDQDLYAGRTALLDELNNLVRNNYLYYNPTLAEYKLQGRSMEIGLHRYVQELAAES